MRSPASPDGGELDKNKTQTKLLKQSSATLRGLEPPPSKPPTGIEGEKRGASGSQSLIFSAARTDSRVFRSLRSTRRSHQLREGQPPGITALPVFIRSSFCSIFQLIFCASWLLDARYKSALREYKTPPTSSRIYSLAGSNHLSAAHYRNYYSAPATS